MKGYLKYSEISKVKNRLKQEVSTTNIRAGTIFFFFSAVLLLRRSVPTPGGTRLTLGPGLADPVVLVHPGPREGEGGPVRFEALLVLELRVWTSGRRSVRRERVSGEGLPLLPQPDLRSAGGKLAELWRRKNPFVAFRHLRCGRRRYPALPGRRCWGC